MKRVLIESPYASLGHAAALSYLERCVHDCLSRGEAPLASHGFYTQFLDDQIPEQRREGMEAGFAWGAVAELVAVYSDHGVSAGMVEGIKRATGAGIPVEHRFVGAAPATEPNSERVGPRLEDLWPSQVATLRALYRAGRPLTLGALEEATGLAKTTQSGLLCDKRKGLLALGLVERPTRGHYILTSAGAQLLGVRLRDQSEQTTPTPSTTQTTDCEDDATADLAECADVTQPTGATSVKEFIAAGGTITQCPGPGFVEAPTVPAYSWRE